VQIDKTEMPGLAPGIFISGALPKRIEFKKPDFVKDRDNSGF